MKYKYIAKKYWNFTLPALSKTNEMAKRYDDIIDLSIGDPDYPVDNNIIEKMYKEALKGHTRYTEFLGDPELREAIAKNYDKYSMNFDIDNIMITAGGTPAMFLLLQAICDEGDEIIVIAPYYIYYEPQIEMARAKLVVYKTDKDNNFDIDVDELKKKITHRTRAIIVNTPNNPTGRVYSKEVLEELISLSEEHDFIIIADDIYGALNYTSDSFPICSLAPNNNRIITIYSFSKDFSMTGFRIGYIAGDKKVIACIRNINEGVNFTINSMAQRAAIYAIENKEKLQKPIKEEYLKRVNYVYERIKNIKNMRCNKPEGSFYLFVDIRETGLNSNEIWEKMLDEAHVLALPGSGFNEAGDGFMRIACTTNIDILKEAFDRIEKMKVFGGSNGKY